MLPPPIQFSNHDGYLATIFSKLLTIVEVYALLEIGVEAGIMHVGELETKEIEII